MTAKYKGLYKDSVGMREIEIENDFNTLVMEIDGVVFSGSEFDDLSVDDKLKYTEQQLTRFTFFQTPQYQTKKVSETLCNCSFEIIVPQIIIDKSNNDHFLSDLKIEVFLGNARKGNPGSGIEFETVTLSLTIAGKIYAGTSELFEGSFDQIRDQLQDKYQLKNCYGCMYADYSVYGQGTFGTMLCFRDQKTEYSKVTNKDEYTALAPSYLHVQEIYCCNEYETRKKGAGYRS